MEVETSDFLQEYKTSELEEALKDGKSQVSMWDDFIRCLKLDGDEKRKFVNEIKKVLATRGRGKVKPAHETQSMTNSQMRQFDKDTK